MIQKSCNKHNSDNEISFPRQEKEHCRLLKDIKRWGIHFKNVKQKAERSPLRCFTAL